MDIVTENQFGWDPPMMAPEDHVESLRSPASSVTIEEEASPTFARPTKRAHSTACFESEIVNPTNLNDKLISDHAEVVARLTERLGAQEEKIANFEKTVRGLAGEVLVLRECLLRAAERQVEAEDRAALAEERLQVSGSIAHGLGVRRGAVDRRRRPQLVAAHKKHRR